MAAVSAVLLVLLGVVVTTMLGTSLRDDLRQRLQDRAGYAVVLQQQGVKAAVPADQPDTLQLPPLPDEALAALVCTLAESGVGVVGLTAQTKSLEDIFLSLTQTSGEVA